MVQGVDHVAIALWDIEKSLPYYVERLGLKLVHDEVLQETGVRLAYLEAGSTVLQLVEPLRDGSVRRFLEERGEGLHHVCFSVQNLPEALGHLDGERRADIFPGGRGRRSCNLLHHPNGVNIELTELKPSRQEPTNHNPLGGEEAAT